MATIHATTMTPGKLELLAAWMPLQPWYAGPVHPDLIRSGGFRLDDPAGEVGIELMVVTVAGGSTFFVPLTYRGAPLPSSNGLVGTSEHGVLGTRWIYDGVADPVLRAQLTALLLGAVAPQHQTRSDEGDDSVEVRTTTSETAAGSARVVRRLVAGPTGTTPGVSLTWTAEDGALVSGCAVQASGSSDVLNAPFPEQCAVFLDEHRAALRACLDGLTEEQARRSLVSSRTTLLGLVKHAAFVERVWFGEAVTGASRAELGLPAHPDESFVLTDSDTIASVRAAHEAACEASRSAVADLGPDDVVHGNRRGPLTLRWVFLHVLRELAQHCGHADILREQVLG